MSGEEKVEFEQDARDSDLLDQLSAPEVSSRENEARDAAPFERHPENDDNDISGN